MWAMKNGKAVEVVKKPSTTLQGITRDCWFIKNKRDWTKWTQAGITRYKSDGDFAGECKDTKVYDTKGECLNVQVAWLQKQIDALEAQR